MELLQGLLRFDTTNPPGNERECIEWRHEPFAGELHDGYVWGRGALDMKGGVAMMLAAFMRIKAAGLAPPGDVILTGCST